MIPSDPVPAPRQAPPHRWLLAAGLLLLAARATLILAGEPARVALEPQDAGPDFVAQGEYAGAVDGAALGVQVAAFGDGAFVVAVFPGGLPGAGGDVAKRVEGKGRRDGDGVAIAAGAWKGRVEGGSLILSAPAAATLPRVERTSPTMGAKPPPGASTLFDGTSVEHWNGGRIDERGLLACGATTRRAFRDFQLHLEFRLPFKPKGRDQDRGNSGVYIQKRYELQVLDSFALPIAFNGCGAMYRQQPPAINMSFPSLAWQTYDVDFTAARFGADGARTQEAVITVRHNGVVVHDAYKLVAKTGMGSSEGPEPGPILLQDHGNPVFYRNVWILERGQEAK